MSLRNLEKIIPLMAWKTMAIMIVSLVTNKQSTSQYNGAFAPHGIPKLALIPYVVSTRHLTEPILKILLDTAH
jgi:hypothetical protein